MKNTNKENKKHKIDKSQLFTRVMALVLAVMMALSVVATLVFALIQG